MDNIVIKNVKKEDGPKIIKYFRSIGVDTKSYRGDVNEKSGWESIYYGTINERFSNYSLNDMKGKNVTILFIDKNGYLRHEIPLELNYEIY